MAGLSHYQTEINTKYWGIKMHLSKRDCKNLIDALMEYDEQICPKELADDEVGLNAERLDDMMRRLIKVAYPRLNAELTILDNQRRRELRD